MAADQRLERVQIARLRRRDKEPITGLEWSCTRYSAKPPTKTRRQEAFHSVGSNDGKRSTEMVIHGTV